MSGKSSKNVKKRNWVFVLYPESAPVDWREQLQQSGLQCAISPLHDQDVYEDGEKKGLPKKKHHHIILVYGNPTTYNNVLRLTNKQLGQTIPQPLEQVRGMYRYFTHEDNPDKAQYSKSDIVTLNGFDIRDFVEMSRSEVVRFKREIQEFIQGEDLVEYADLMDKLLAGGEAMADWYEVASNNTLFFQGYLKSRKFGNRQREVKEKLKEIGERERAKERGESDG